MHPNFSKVPLTFGDGGRFSSSENEGERGFRRRRVGLGVAGGEGDGVVGCDFPKDCSESSWRSSGSSEPESSVRESSSSRSSSSPLPCEPQATTRSPFKRSGQKEKVHEELDETDVVHIEHAPVANQRACCPPRPRSVSSCGQKAASSSSSSGRASSPRLPGWSVPLVDGQRVYSSSFHSNMLVTWRQAYSLKL